MNRYVKITLYIIFILIGIYAINRLYGFYIYPAISYYNKMDSRKKLKIVDEKRERNYMIFHIKDLIKNNELDSAEHITNELIKKEIEPRLIQMKAHINFLRNNYMCASLLYDSVMRMTSVIFEDTIIIYDTNLYYSSLGEKGVSQLNLEMIDIGLNNLLRATTEKPEYYFDICKFYEQKNDIKNLKLYSKKLVDFFPNEKFYLDYYNEVNK